MFSGDITDNKEDNVRTENEIFYLSQKIINLESEG